MSTVRDVPIEDVTWKVQATGTKKDELWCMHVAYADARIYGERLDAWIGEFGWSDEYRLFDLAGRLACECTITIYSAKVTLPKIGDNPPVTRMVDVLRRGWAEVDTGPDAREVVKGAESDAFKRAAAKCGIGRNLYRLPKLFTPGIKNAKDKIVAPRFVGDLTMDEGLEAKLAEALAGE